MYSCWMQGGKNAENSRRKIFIGGLPSSVTENQLKEYFARYGQVCSRLHLLLSCFNVFVVKLTSFHSVCVCVTLKFIRNYAMHHTIGLQ